MTKQLYQVGDRVRASHVGSMILESAVVVEIVEKWTRYLAPTPKGIEREVPLYWIRFERENVSRPRWQNELIPEPVLETTT